MSRRHSSFPAAALAFAAGLFLVAGLVPAASAQNSGSQSLEVAPDQAELQVRWVMYHRLMAEVLRSGIREQADGGASEVNPYPGMTAGKALAVCVNWQRSTLDRVVWGGFAYRFGAAVTAEQQTSIDARTLDDCRAAYAGRDCQCALLDSAGANVLEVPRSFLEEYARF